MIRNVFLLLALIFFSKEPGAQLKADIKDLGFMAGKWSTAHKWGDMDEVWGEPAGNTMICAYRCIKDGKVVFYEFIVIEQTDSVPVMRLRHFGPGSIAWEEKDKPWSYPLVELADNKAVFEAPDKMLRMTFLRKDEKHLTVMLEKRKAAAVGWQKDLFEYSRKY